MFSVGRGAGCRPYPRAVITPVYQRAHALTRLAASGSAIRNYSLPHGTRPSDQTTAPRESPHANPAARESGRTRCIDGFDVNMFDRYVLNVIIAERGY